MFRNCLLRTAETERDPRNNVKCFFVDILAAVQTFTVAAILDASHSFADTLEPREIAALEREEQFTVWSDRVEIASIFGIDMDVVDAQDPQEGSPSGQAIKVDDRQKIISVRARAVRGTIRG